MISPADERVMEAPAGSADGERRDMTQRTVGRFLAGAALAVTLTFAGAAPAGAWPITDGVWSRLAEILAGWGVAPGALVHLPHGGQRSGSAQFFQKAEYCSDLNGHSVTCAGSQTSGAGVPRCTAWNDQGACVDPNG